MNPSVREYSGRGRAKLPVTLFDALSLAVGDAIYVSISAKETCLCASWPAREDDVVLASRTVLVNKPTEEVGPEANMCRVVPSVGSAEEITVISRDASASLKPQQLQALLMGLFVECGAEVSKSIVVTGTCPAGVVKVDHRTRCRFISDPRARAQLQEIGGNSQDPTEDDAPRVAGLDHAFRTLMEVVALPLRCAGTFQNIGVEPVRAVLLHGPSGVGKTSLVHMVARACHVPIVVGQGSALHGQFTGETEARLRDLFSRAEQQMDGCIVFIDDLDALCSKRETVNGARVTAQLLTLMDGIASQRRVVVVGATSSPNVLDPALRRPGRFDREVSIHVPNQDSRLEIMRVLTERMPLSAGVSLEEVARRCVGYVGADLAALSREAAMDCQRRAEALLVHGHHAAASELCVEMEDFDRAMKTILPSIAKDASVAVEPTYWEDIGGLEDVKARLRQAIEWPILHKSAFERLGLKAPSGILLHGPPGCCKTTLAKAIATTAEATTFLSVSGADVYSAYLGGAEAHIRGLFERARRSTPAVIFFDEIDALVGRRGFGGDSDGGVQERVLSTMLNEMDGVEQRRGVLVVAATNRLDMIDDAILRPGRLEHIIYVPVPDTAGRLAILEVHSRKMPLEADVDLSVVVQHTSGRSGAELELVCREAALIALKEDIEATRVAQRHFILALASLSSRVRDTSPPSSPPALGHEKKRADVPQRRPKRKTPLSGKRRKPK